MEESLVKRTLKGLKERRSRLLNGEINSVPSPFKRFSEDFVGIELVPKYYVVTASTKGAKTQLANALFIYTTLNFAFEHPEQLSVKIFYYPFEETPEDILTRYISYLLYTMSGCKIRVDPTNLRSTRNDRPLPQEILDLLDSEEYQARLKFFEDNVIFSSSTNPTGVYNECKKYAEEHGTVYTRKQIVRDEYGLKKEVDVFDWYEPDDKKELRIAFIDHASLISTERGMTLKQSIDKLSEYGVLLRNRYWFSFVLVQQQAFAGETLDAFKENKLRPTIANLADSKYPARDANVVLGLFSPFKFELADYLEYDITKLKDNVRFLEVIINRGGSPGGIVALYFDGAVNYFKELPPPRSAEIQRVYQSLKEMREKPKSRAMIMWSKIIKLIKK